MKSAMLAGVGRLRRRCHQWLGGGFDYRVAYRKAALDQGYWGVVGAGSREEFENLGVGKRNLLIDLGLTPDARVLDVGCGTGALTATLADYLSPQGLYYGTDIAQEAVDFCLQKYRRPNFHFRRNDLTQVPIEGVRFDIIFFGSVFTHLYPEEIRDMLVEVRRLLDPKGLIVADLFLDSGIDRFRGDRGMVVINEAHLLELFATTGLRLELFREFPCSPDAHPAYRGWPCGPATRRAFYKFALESFSQGLGRTG